MGNDETCLAVTDWLVIVGPKRGVLCLDPDVHVHHGRKMDVVLNSLVKYYKLRTCTGFSLLILCIKALQI